LTVLEKKYQVNQKIRIRKLISTSLIDWEGLIVSTLYVGGCNFRCPFCYNVDLITNPQQFSIIPEEDIVTFLKERKDFLDGICLSGGEPTIYDDLPEFLVKIRKHNIKIKLDTNGSQPERLAEIIERNLVDFIAMDIKSCLKPEAYKKAIGINDEQVISKIKKSINLIRCAGIEYEFRTTVIPIFHDEKTIEEIAREIKGSNQYVLQNFINNGQLLDKQLVDIVPYPPHKIEEFRSKIEPYVERCKVR
jgi:pyruvate formate lyase activating enzyme